MIGKTVNQGFALVETLVSAAIIAAMLGVTFQSITASARQSRMIEARRLALLVAQSQMAVAQAAISSSFGETNGVSNDIRWRVTITPYPASTAASVPLEQIIVKAGNGAQGASLVSLKTLRIAR